MIGALATSEISRAWFSELERKVEGISQRMLATTLRNLERDGIIKREVFAEVPLRVEYELTDLGDSLTVPIKHLVDWIVDHAVPMKTALEVFDRNLDAKAKALDARKS